MQSFQPLFNPATMISGPQLLNVPEPSLLGADFDVQWIPADGWLVKLGLGLLANVTRGNKFPNTAKTTFIGLVRKEMQLGEGMASVQTNLRYQSFVTYDLANARNLSQPG